MVFAQRYSIVLSVYSSAGSRDEDGKLAASKVAYFAMFHMFYGLCANDRGAKISATLKSWMVTDAPAMDGTWVVPE